MGCVLKAMPPTRGSPVVVDVIRLLNSPSLLQEGFVLLKLAMGDSQLLWLLQTANVLAMWAGALAASCI